MYISAEVLSRGGLFGGAPYLRFDLIFVENLTNIFEKCPSRMAQNGAGGSKTVGTRQRAVKDRIED